MCKTITFAIVHMTVAFCVGFAMTGDALVGGALALVEPMFNTVAYYFHEKVWKRLEARRQGQPGDAVAPGWVKIIDQRWVSLDGH